jgi:hypothetical protein
MPGALVVSAPGLCVFDGYAVWGWRLDRIK